MSVALEALGRGATVVTATRRLARYLRGRHDASRLAAGVRAWETPDVLSWDAWVGRLWEHRVLEEAAPDLLTDDEERLLWRQVVAAGGGGSSLDAAPLGELARQAWRLCSDWAIDGTALATGADSADCQAFARWAMDFQEQCGRAGRLDRGRAAVMLAHSPPRGLDAEHCFAGFDPWPVTHARLSAGLDVAVSLAVEEAPAGAVYRKGCADAAEEIRLAAAWARARLKADPRSRIGLIVPDLASRGGEVRRACLDALAPGWQLEPPRDCVLGFSLGRPLARYPVIHGALLALRVAAGPVPWTEVSQLIRSRYLRGADQEAAGRAAADVRLRDGREEVPALSHLVRLCRPTAPVLAGMLAGLGVHQKALAMAPGGWVTPVAELLASTGWPGDRPLDQVETQAVIAWHRLLQSLGSLDRWHGPLSFGSVVELLLDLASHRPFEPGGGEEGLQVMGLLEAEGQQFDGLWVCGLTGADWPPGPHPHPLLPLALQRRLGLPGATPDSSREAAARRLRRLLGSAPVVVCSWPQRHGDETLDMSPWLAGLPTLPADSGWEDYRSDREIVAAAGGCQDLADDRPPRFQASGYVPGGASLLNHQAACPARAFAEGRLGARELPVPEPPLGARSRGQLLHRVLEELYIQPDCRHGLDKLPPARLRELADAVLDRVLPDLLPAEGRDFRRRLQMLERARLHRLIAQLASLDAGRGDFAVEVESSRELTLGRITVRLRLDRLDTLADGHRMVIDYKTGRFAVSGWRAERLTECQLPAYAVAGQVDGIAVLHLALPALRLSGVGRPGLARTGLRPPDRFFSQSGYRWEDAVEHWRTRLEELAAEFVRGDFRVDPGAPAQALGQYAALTRAWELVRFPAGDEAGP